MNKTNTRKALSPAYRKHKPLRKDVNEFVNELTNCLSTIKLIDKQGESEEHIKQPIKAFLQNTFYKDYYINTKDKIDLAIYNGNDIKSDVAVLIEVKRPSNTNEFLTKENLNRKALHELLLYYLDERIKHNNNNIKHLIVTNGYQWFLFKSEDFYNFFFKNKALIKEYNNFISGNKDSKNNPLFYEEIAPKYIKEIQSELPFIHLDFTKKNIEEYNDANLNTLFKIFSDVHILGADYGNDSNRLNKEFYNELLHIIGLEEVKEKGKKIITRKAENKRDYASILENVIFTIEDRDYLSNIKSIPSGKNKIFEASLELTLTWINRILFLKLLESQLLSYNSNAKEYHFLNSEFLKGFDDLNSLFFSALAKKNEERHPKYKERFKHIPYLNSSLFERNILENESFEISALNDEELEIYKQTVLKDNKGKRISGKINTLEYLFRFLDAYDFAADGKEGIEDGIETKTLINASVLGLIFEKINGYKEGSFYTPAYITMYMSRETLRRAVVQKFKEQENENIDSFDKLQNYINQFFGKENKLRFNKIINSIRIVDPAVGSGHFLVSVLNELIFLKKQLGILVDQEGIVLQCDSIIIDNDELYITDQYGHLFDYKPQLKETAKIQKTLFHEKQTIIENCLFGVDINPNSVKICRLRLWIELLKNAYYTDDRQLQTLPNIDINTKTGNSLISRFELQDDLKTAFSGKDVKYTFADYRNAVAEYKETNDKSRKKQILEIIEDVKNSFKIHLTRNNKTNTKLSKLKNKFYDLFAGNVLFEPSVPYGKNNLEKEREKLRKKMEKEINNLEDKLNQIKSNNIYDNAFEWRFEFPEVLDDEGNYIGFDVVIGNPPYIQLQSMGDTGKIYSTFNFYTYMSMGDLYALFYEQGNNIMKSNGHLCFITGSAWMRTNYGKALRKFFSEHTNPRILIDLSDCEVFDSATVLTSIMLYKKEKCKNNTKAIRITRKDQKVLPQLQNYFQKNSIILDELPETSWIISNNLSLKIKQKIEKQGVKLINWDVKIYRGILTGFNEAFIISSEKKNELIAKDPKSAEIIKPLLRGRDVKKYNYQYANLWLICTHNGIKEKSINKINIEKYPAIKKHLDAHFSKLKKRTDKGDTPYNLRNCAYLKDFEKPKIIYSELTKFLFFAFDTDSKYIDKTAFIWTGDNIYYLVCFLNSKLFKLCFSNNFSEIQGNTRVMSKIIFEQIPIKKITENEEKPFTKKVNQILNLKKSNSKADTSKLEAQIDQMIYKLYELTPEEIEIVENSVN